MLALPTIDFDKYKQVLENTQVVNEVQNALQSFKPNALNVDLVLKDLEEQKEKAVSQ